MLLHLIPLVCMCAIEIQITCRKSTDCFKGTDCFILDFSLLSHHLVGSGHDCRFTFSQASSSSTNATTTTSAVFAATTSCQLVPRVTPTSNKTTTAAAAAAFSPRACQGYSSGDLPSISATDMMGDCFLLRSVDRCALLE